MHRSRSRGGGVAACRDAPDLRSAVLPRGAKASAQPRLGGDHGCIGFGSLPQFNTLEINAGLIREPALSGWGICRLSDFQEGRLVALFPERIKIAVNRVCAICPQKKRPQREILAFVEHLKEALSPAPPRVLE